MLRDGKPFLDIGGDYYRQSNAEQTIRRSIRNLETLGYRVNIEPITDEINKRADDRTAKGTTESSPEQTQSSNGPDSVTWIAPSSGGRGKAYRRLIPVT